MQTTQDAKPQQCKQHTAFFPGKGKKKYKTTKVRVVWVIKNDPVWRRKPKKIHTLPALRSFHFQYIQGQVKMKKWDIKSHFTIPAASGNTRNKVFRYLKFLLCLRMRGGANEEEDKPTWQELILVKFYHSSWQDCRP